MARNIKEQPKEEKEAVISIEEIIDEYFDNNTKKNAADKIVKALSTQIKKYLGDKNLTSYKGKNHTATLSSSESVSYDEIKLITIIKSLPEELQEGLIDKIEVVNMTALERAIIENKLDVKQFVDAEQHKITTKLFVK